MSDDLDISAGGAVAVDTETLRHAARGFDRLGAELDDVVALLVSAGGDLAAGPATSQRIAYDIDAVHAQTGERAQGAREVAARLREAAAIYETVELWAERRAAQLAGNDSAVGLIERRIRALHGDHPEAAFSAALLVARHTLLWPSDMITQGQTTGALLSPYAAAGILLGTLTHGLRGAGFGRVPAGAGLSGPPSAVTVHRLSPTGGPVGAPRSFADLASRMPAGSAQVRIEKYTFAGRPAQYVVYVAGTRSAALGGTQPFDNRSNLQLYSGRRSASYDATVAAMADAGIRPGDIVHTAAHSQAAMITSHLALDGAYDTRTLVTFGSPVHAAVGEEVLAVTVRHTDDPVAALAGGGHAQEVGAPGSFVVERSADPDAGLDDVTMPAHDMAAYVETAARVDGSDDPRVDGVHDLVDMLAEADAVEVFEYSAHRRAERSGGGGGS
ncbi:hypothetical protein [Microbacterium xanthum]|uniref:hypothetical protein n=1 Tax=Microbacterium xanthum TaxID=3079794 RepID=UPI002AD573F1|nr:hypothetical protein [Microbacterium sp. KSW-48]MDZ8173042.1 hypothetical protein [Microbacterium sp. KSW-48]